MRTMSEERIKFYKEQYPRGTRICLDSMGDDDPNPVPSGTEGSVSFVDDVGTVFVDFDNGRSLDRRKSRERYDAYLRGEYIPPNNPPQISKEIQDKMLDMFAAILAKEYRKELEQQAQTRT